MVGEGEEKTIGEERSRMVVTAQAEDRQRSYISPSGDVLPIGNENHKMWISKNREVLQKHDVSWEDLISPISSKEEYYMLLRKGWIRKTHSGNHIAYEIEIGTDYNRLISGMDADIWREIEAMERRAPGSSSRVEITVSVITPFPFQQGVRPDWDEMKKWAQEHQPVVINLSSQEFMREGSVKPMLPQQGLIDSQRNSW